MGEIDRQAEAGVAVAEVPVSDSHLVACPSRRRVIRLAASAVPVLATLSSQSALAGACISTSAWGSAQISNTASQAAHTFAVAPSWTITAWNAKEDNLGTPWYAFKSKYGISANPKSLTFADLYAKVGSIYMRSPSSLGFDPTAKVVGGLGNNDHSFFLVAMLNYAVEAIAARPPTECVSDANWLAIVADQYPTIGSPWTVPQIRMYLENNWIVRFV